MDFRSQLSAFQSGGGGSGGDRNNRETGNKNPNNQNNGGGRGYSNSNANANSNARGYNNNNNNNNNSNNSSGSYYGRGNDGRDSRDNNNYHRDNNRGGGGDFRREDNKRRNRPYDAPQQPQPQRRRYHSPDRDGLGDLRQFGYIIPKGNPVLPAATQTKKKKSKSKHIALLAITIDDLPYENIWKAWVDTLKDTDNKDEYYVSLVCHAKFPDKVTSQFLKDRMLLRRPKLGRGNSYLDPEFLSRTPEWGSVEITRAMLDLLQEAAKIGQDDQKDARFSSNRFIVRMPGQTIDTTVPPKPQASSTIPPVDQFLFISETCLPVRTGPEAFRLLPGPTVSWINARHRKDPKTPKNKYEDDQFALISRKIPGQFRWKADQWVLLGRLHATAILALDRPHFHPRHQLWQHFRNINASDEMYIPTAMALLGYLRYTLEGEDTQRARNEPAASTSPKKEPEETKKAATTANPPPPPEMVLKRAVTYTDWTEGMRNPACFTKGMMDFQKVGVLARSKGCLVARKFAPKVAMPNDTSEQQDITKEKGYITAQEWLEAVQKWEQEDLAKAEASADKEDDEEEDQDEEEEAPKDANVANVETPTSSATKANAKAHKDSDEEGEAEEDNNNDDDDDDDDDDDQQENELE